MTLAAIKAALRDEMFQRRKHAFAARSPADADLLRQELARQSGRALSGYMPMRTEIDCLPAMAAHAGPVGVPVIVAKATPLRFREWTVTTEMVPGPFGASVPASGEWIVPEVLIVPLLAFDRRGHRLGYGGGFYDRTLEGLRAASPDILAIGFAFAAQEVDEVPTEPVDQPLDLIVTEREVIRPRA